MYTSSRQTPSGIRSGHGGTEALPSMKDYLSNRLPTPDTSLQVIPNPPVPAATMSTSLRQTHWGTHSGHGRTAGLSMIWGFLSGRHPTADTSSQVLLSPSVLSTWMFTSSRQMATASLPVSSST